MEKENILEVVHKLVGKVSPCGESGVDAERLENMKNLIWIMDQIHSKVDDIAYRFKDSPYASERRIGVYADEFLKDFNS